MKLSTILNSYFKKIKESRPQFVWFNKSQDTDNGWINQAIQMKDIATTDEDWFVNMFIKDGEGAVDEFKTVVTELGKHGFHLVEETKQDCKNGVVRYLVDRGLPSPATATAEESPF
tara:strand:+ start:6669 stop:7016 length:348 start_codon:yes stop_codon:yes gene_type:complete